MKYFSLVRLIRSLFETNKQSRPETRRRTLLGTTTESIYATIALAVPQISRANWIGIDDSALKNGDIDFGTIPLIIINVTDYLLGLVGTIAMIMIIYGSVRMGFGSLSGDKEIGKKVITAGIIGFVISVSGWFIVNLIIDNF